MAEKGRSGAESERIFTSLGAAQQWVKERRRPLLLVAVVIFGAGLAWSLLSLNLRLSDLRALPATIIFFVIAPLGLLYGAFGLMLLARVAGHSIPLGSSWTIAGYAQLAESLPLPGGAIVRTSALLRAGAGLVRSLALVTATAILWVAMATAGAALAILSTFPLIALGMAALGSLTVLAIIGWLAKVSSARIALLIVAHRVAGLGLMAMRMYLAFAVLGETLNPQTAFYFALSNIAGSAVAFAPAGLGVGEAIAAGMSGLVDIDPAVAFLAIAVNRCVTLASCAATVGLTSLVQSSRDASRGASLTL